MLAALVLGVLAHGGRAFQQGNGVVPVARSASMELKSGGTKRHRGAMSSIRMASARLVLGAYAKVSAGGVEDRRSAASASGMALHAQGARGDGEIKRFKMPVKQIALVCLVLQNACQVRVFNLHLVTRHLHSPGIRFLEDGDGEQSEQNKGGAGSNMHCCPTCLQMLSMRYSRIAMAGSTPYRTPPPPLHSSHSSQTPWSKFGFDPLPPLSIHPVASTAVVLSELLKLISCMVILAFEYRGRLPQTLYNEIIVNWRMTAKV